MIIIIIPIYVMPLGIVIDNSLLQPLKVLSGILVTLGILIDLNDVQDLKVPPVGEPIFVTVVGNDKDTIEVHPWNAVLPIVVTPVGIVIDINEEQ